MSEQQKEKKPRKRKTLAERLQKVSEAQLGKMRSEAQAVLDAVAGEVSRRKEALDKM